MKRKDFYIGLFAILHLMVILPPAYETGIGRADLEFWMMGDWWLLMYFVTVIPLAFLVISEIKQLGKFLK
ncbi:MAG: hypothetical protein HUJ58_00650 [Erysipelotrichaceae bacterium]|nr:hypothetical protein [Erysipelotrichaceae bacterium]